MLSNAGINLNTGVDTQITGVDGPITGVNHNTYLCPIPKSTQVETNVERTNPPNHVCRQIEVEDVDSDDNDNDKTNKSSHAPKLKYVLTT